MRRVSAGGGLNVRSLPTQKSPSITIVPEGAFVHIEELKGPAETIGTKSGTWARVRFGQVVGWAFGAFLEPVETFVYEPSGKASTVLDKRLHESLDCTGLSYSEYAGDLIFKANGQFEYGSAGAVPLACNSEKPNITDGLNGTVIRLYKGTYTSDGKTIVLRNLSGTAEYRHETKGCRFPAPAKRMEKLPSIVMFYPVICRDSIGGQYPAVVSPDFGYSPRLIWVFNKDSSGTPSPNNR